MDTQGEFRIYASSDGVRFEKVNADMEELGGSAGYSLRLYSMEELEAGTRYIKISYPGEVGWREHISHVLLIYDRE